MDPSCVEFSWQKASIDPNLCMHLTSSCRGRQSLSSSPRRESHWHSSLVATSCRYEKKADRWRVGIYIVFYFGIRQSCCLGHKHPLTDRISKACNSLPVNKIFIFHWFSVRFHELVHHHEHFSPRHLQWVSSSVARGHANLEGANPSIDRTPVDIP